MLDIEINDLRSASDRSIDIVKKVTSELHLDTSDQALHAYLHILDIQLKRNTNE